MTPETVGARKAAVQAETEALVRSNLPKEDLEVRQRALEQHLKILTGLEDAWQKHVTYIARLEGLPQRLQQLEAERKMLEAQPSRQFPDATAEVRGVYEAQLHAALAELLELSRDVAAGEVRLAALPKELEQRGAERTRLEQALQAARGKAGRADDQASERLHVELLALQLQLVDAEVKALEAERGWLTKRGPLLDALRGVVQMRVKHSERDLDTIRQALSTDLQKQQATLDWTAAGLEQQLEQTLSPTDATVFAVNRETVEIRKATTHYREELNRFRNQVLTEEKRYTEAKQGLDHLTSLVEKYAGGEGLARQLLVAFERLRAARGPDLGTTVQAIEARRRALRGPMFTLDVRLYEFDRMADGRLAELQATPASAAPEPREADVARVRQALDEQKAALREQQQVLAELEQALTKLLSLQHERQRLMGDAYRFVLTNMLWLRDAERLNWGVAQDMLAGAMAAATRLHAFARAEAGRLRASLSGAAHLWLLAVLGFTVLVWVAHRADTHLRGWVASSLAGHASRGTPPGIGVVIVIAIQSAVWPAYLALVAWSREQFLPQNVFPAASALALVGGLQVGAVVLWLGLFGRTIFEADGWGERFWGLSPELRRVLRHTVTGGCLAALVLLVPYHILRSAPGEGETVAGSLALARLLFLVFQGVILVLVGITGRRRSPLMVTVLASSREGHGLLWRVWPFIYGGLLSGVVGLVTLDMLGYHYVSQFIWIRTLKSLLVVLLVLVLRMVVLRLLNALIARASGIGGRPQPHSTDIEQAANRPPTLLRLVSHGLFALLAVVIILEIWGVSIPRVLTSPLGYQAVRRVTIIAVTLGLMILLMRVSRALTAYLLQPKTTQGVTREAGRKLRTLAPLVQTLIKGGAVVVVVMVVLEQLGVSTGPVLTGVGIFGLAVGFAAQSLIKDVINGLFILFEDSLSVGDFVTLRGIDGQVEHVSLRAITIRDLSGNVHVIPNSSIDLVTNMTKDYSRYLLDVRVAYRENVDTIIEILQEIDASMRRDPKYRRGMLEPIEIMGLDRFDESAVIIRARLKTRPMQQWRIGREFNHRMKQVFDERGIEIPLPHRTLYWGMPPKGSQPPVQMAAEDQQPLRPED